MFEKALTLDRGDTQMMENMADSYRALGNQERAHAAYQQAIYLGNKELESNPKNVEVLEQVALAYAKTGIFRKAKVIIGRARALHPDDPDAIYVDAEIEALSGNESGAMQALRPS